MKFEVVLNCLFLFFVFFFQMHKKEKKKRGNGESAGAFKQPLDVNEK